MKNGRFKSQIFLDASPELLNGILAAIPECKSCTRGKMTAEKHLLSERIPEYCCDILSVDLALGVPENLQNKTCVLIVADFYSNFIWSVPLNSKSAAKGELATIISYIERQYWHKVRCIRSDDGGE